MSPFLAFILLNQSAGYRLGFGIGLARYALRPKMRLKCRDNALSFLI